MSRRHVESALLVVVAVAVAGGFVWAQQGQGEPPRRPAMMAADPGGPGMLPPPGAEGPRAAGLGWLIGQEPAKVETANTEKGVKVIVRAEQADMVAPLRQGVRQRLERVQQLQAAAGAAGGGRRGGEAAGRPAVAGLMGLLASGQVKAEAQDVENGVAVLFTSDNADVAKRLQQEVPQAVAAAGPAMAPEEVRKLLQEQVQAMRLLGSDKVTIATTETEKGLRLTINSDDPELAKQIQKELPAYFQSMKERSRLMERFTQMRGAQEGPGMMGPRPLMPMPGAPAPEGRVRGGRAGTPPPPPAE